MSSNITIDYEAILEKIHGQLIACRNSDPSFARIELVVENERQFTIEQEMKPNTIYVVIHYGESSVNFGQLILPVNFDIISERNKIELVQKLFLLYTTAYNLKRNGNLAQFYSTPVVENAFVEIKNGWRANLSFSGAFIVGASNSDYVKELDYNGDPIDILSFNESYKNDLRPQPTPDGGGFAHSVSGFATHSFSITTYLTTSAFCKKLNDQRYNDNMEDTTYSFTLVLNSGTAFTNRAYKCLSIEIGQKIGDSTIVSVAFSL